MARLIDGDALCRVLNDHWLATSPSDRDTAEVAAERAAMCRGLDYAMRIVEQMPTVGGWVSVKDALPRNQVTVLVVKELKSGQRNIGLGYCIPEYKIHDYTTGEDRVEPYWVCGGNNHVIYWMELPKMPKE